MSRLGLLTRPDKAVLVSNTNVTSQCASPNGDQPLAMLRVLITVLGFWNDYRGWDTCCDGVTKMHGGLADVWTHMSGVLRDVFGTREIS